MQRSKLGPGWCRGAASLAPGPGGGGVCWFQNKVGLGWHAGARRPSYFPGFVSQAAREGNDSHLEAEVQAPKEDHRDRKAKPASGRRGPQAQSLNLPAGPAGRRRLGTSLTRSGPLAAPSPATQAGNLNWEVASQL